MQPIDPSVLDPDQRRGDRELAYWMLTSPKPKQDDILQKAETKAPGAKRRYTATRQVVRGRVSHYLG